MKIVCCLLGLHDWSTWIPFINARYDYRRCKRCFKSQKRKVV